MLKTNWTKADKYNLSDLDRVEAATATLAALLTSCGYPVTITTKTDWVSGTDWPTEAQMARYLGNVRKCVTQYNAVPGVTLPASMANFDYNGANNIEKTIEGITAMVAQMQDVYRRCGAFECGGD